MSNKKTMLIITVFAFAVGFLANEYRHLPLAEQNGIANNDLGLAPVPAVAESSQGVSSSSEAPNLVNVEAKTANIPGDWAAIEQLISVGRYDEAIHLLEVRMGKPEDAPRAWLLLASIYKKQQQPVAAVDAWFRYVKLELDDQNIEGALKDIKNYLVQLKETPALFNENYPWLMAQLNELLKYKANDGELHLMMAALLMQLNNTYEAQYHALMAANDPGVQQGAERILAKLKGKDMPEEVSIPLTRMGNQYIVNIDVEGYPAKLLLDTGASLSGLSSTYTARYPFMLKSTRPIRLNTANGAYHSVLFTVSSISMGNLVFNQHILAQLALDNTAGFDGLLGVDILGRFDFVIDQDAALLRLKARKQ